MKNPPEDIDLMYNMCSFDKAWRPKKLSPWCAAFSQSDLEVSCRPNGKVIVNATLIIRFCNFCLQILEYREDLEYYYEDGYGFPINYVQACPPVKDVYDNFRYFLLLRVYSLFL